MIYQVTTSGKFIRDLKRLKKRSISDFKLLQNFTNMLVATGGKYLDKKYEAHKLSGNYKGYWECHIKSDLLLIWEENEKQLIIELIRTGTHSDLF